MATSQLIRVGGLISIPFGKIGAHPHTAPSIEHSDKLTLAFRQAAEHRLELAYTFGPLMLAHDRCVFEIPMGV